MLRSTLMAIVIAVPAMANEAPYAGQENRAVSSFSQTDIEALKSGGGWGLAKPAELNGWPGPRHVLDLSEELQLSPDQESVVQALFDDMNARARALGIALIEHEQALDDAFKSGAIDAAALPLLLAKTETVRRDLRQTHLAAHLATAPILTPHQRMTYAKLRGYGGSAHGQTGHSDHN